jgi:hypothetical protein
LIILFSQVANKLKELNQKRFLTSFGMTASDGAVEERKQAALSPPAFSPLSLHYDYAVIPNRFSGEESLFFFL